MATPFGASAPPEPRRNRWAAPAGIVLGVGALGTVLALTLGRLNPSREPRATAELVPADTLTTSPTPTLAAPSPAPVPPAAPSVPPSTTAAPAAPYDRAEATPTDEPLRALPPIVLHVEPPIDLDAVDAGATTATGTTADAGARATSSADATGDAGAAVAATSASASTAPAASAPPNPPLRVSVPPYSVPCGINTCNVGQVCCNPSCGTCAPPGERCDERPCPGTITYPESQSCGLQTCNVGLTCCNASCGICAPPGEACSQAPCS